MVIDGQAGPTFEDAYGFTFSADGAHLAYQAKVQTHWWMIVDGKREERINMGSSSPHFSPNGKRLAYIAGEGPMYWVVVDGRPGPRLKEIPWRTYSFSPELEPVPPFTEMRFSPDSSHVAYWASDGKQWRLFVDQQPVGGHYNKFVGTGPSFHQDGSLEVLGIRGGVLYRLVGKLKSDGKNPRETPGKSS